MNNNVSAEGVETIANELKEIATVLNDDYDSIKVTISKINDNLDILKSWNGQDAIQEPYPFETGISTDNVFKTPSQYRQYYKYVWDIKADGADNASTALSTAVFEQTQENINLLDMESTDLSLLSTTLYSFITTLSSLLQVDFDGDIKNFFTSIKDNEGWKETQRIAEESKAQKEKDELYLKFRSTDGNDDYVDFFLDELGNRRYPQGLSGISDDGTYSDRGTSKYGEWYTNYFANNESSNAKYMTNDAAFCAAAVTYALTSSGNENAITPYISVETGATDAKNRSANGEGVWHSASDTTYQPQRGDIFYKVDNESHTGVVLGSDENYIYTIEANTSSDFKDGWSFGTVNTRVRDKSYVNTGNSLSGYFSPNVNINNSISNVEISKETINSKLDTTRMNNRNN